MRRPARQAAAWACLILVLARLALWAGPAPAEAANQAAKLAQAHFTRHGTRLPTPAFTAALRAAAADISHLSCRNSLVLLAMANEDAFNHTVPLFLHSLSRVRMQGGRQAGETLDARLVVVVWSRAALAMCRALHARKYRHQCVRDAEHKSDGRSILFHTPAFNALGFAKIKYILNGLSAGHDVVFLDTDIVVLRDPLAHFLSRGAHMLTTLEKCLVVNASVALSSPEFVAANNGPPLTNIGVLYFKASAGVARCVYNWAHDLHQQVKVRPKVWDQDIYRQIMHQCARTHALRWQPLDPRLVQSACYGKCGCAYDEPAITGAKTREGPRRPFVGPKDEVLCGPDAWAGWLLRHFPCSGKPADKSRYMLNLYEASITNHTTRITHWSWK